MNAINNPRFIDGFKMNQEYPDTFEIPSKDEILNIKVGDQVKIGSHKERFWVTILEITVPKSHNELYQFLVKVDNDLVMVENNDINYGSDLTIAENHIIGTQPPELTMEDYERFRDEAYENLKLAELVEDKDEAKRMQEAIEKLNEILSIK